MVKLKKWLTPYLFLSPAAILIMVFTLMPLLNGFYISLHDWNGFSDMTFVGLNNYKTMLASDMFWHSLKNNVVFMAGTVLGKVLLGFFIAMLLNLKIRGIGFYRVLLYTPVLVSFVAIGLLWNWLYNPTFGLINAFLSAVGLISEPIAFLGSPEIVMYAIIFVDLWKWTGNHTIMFLAGLQTLDEDLDDAALIDGASKLQKLLYVIIPQMRANIMVNVTIAAMGAFSVFDLVYVMTKGGPYHSSEVLLTHMYNVAFNQRQYGLGTSIAFILLLIIMVFGLIEAKYLKESGAN